MMPPCTGLHELFESTYDDDHRKARTLCAECPMRAECAATLAEVQADAYSATYGPAGTWAGRLVGSRAVVRKAETLAAEERMFNDAEARAAHAAFVRGERDDRAVIGERVYQRRMKRVQKAHRAGVAA